jgi:hypothetical protein
MAKKTAGQNNGTISLEVTLEREKQLEVLIPRAKAEYQQARIEADKKRSVAEQARQEASAFRKEAIDRRGRDGLNAWEQDHLGTLVNAAENAEEAYQVAQERAECLDRDLTALNQEMSSLDYPLPAEQVLAFQDRLAVALAAVSALDNVIASQEAIIRDCESQIPTLADRTLEREDLLAEIAVGNATADDLKFLDDSIANEKATVDAAHRDAASITAPARQTIAGLARKREEAQANYESLNGQFPRVLASFIKGEAEKNCKEYCAAAVTLVRCLEKHEALQSLHARYGREAIPQTLGMRELYIPVLPLDSCKAHVANPGAVGFKEAVEFRYRSSEEVNSAIDKERASIIALGIDL